MLEFESLQNIQNHNDIAHQETAEQSECEVDIEEAVEEPMKDFKLRTD
jgi:hypothetical protein